MNKTYEEMYLEGHNAYLVDVEPNQCPYLSLYGSHADKIEAWLDGWTQAFRDDWER